MTSSNSREYIYHLIIEVLSLVVKNLLMSRRLTELDNIISSGEAQTISQAMAVYKNREITSGYSFWGNN